MLEKRDLLLFTSVPAIPLTLVLHTVGVAGGLKGRRSACSAISRSSCSFFGTALELVFGPR